MLVTIVFLISLLSLFFLWADMAEQESMSWPLGNADFHEFFRAPDYVSGDHFV